MRPTLIIGLGGTGTRVAGIVYKYLSMDEAISKYAEESIRVFAFDTKKTPESPLITNFVAMQGFDGARIVEEMLRYEENDIRKWWYKNYRPGFIADGAGQVRINGRLALVHNLSRSQSVYHLLENSIKQISQLFAVRSEEAHKVIDVFIVSSIAGGTGSGMIIDVARLVRKLIKMNGFNPRIVGVLIDPRVVENVVSIPLHRRIEANGYATLQEIEYWMKPKQVSEDMFQIKYNRSVHIGITESDKISLRHDRLFEYILYISDQNEDGKFMDSLESYLSLVGLGIYLMTASELSSAEQSTLDNIINHCESLSEIKGRSRFFGSFGISILVFPKEKILEYSAKRLGYVLLEYILQQEVDADEVKEQVNRFMESNRIRELKADEVIEDLKKPREGYAVPNIDIETNLKNAKKENWQDVINQINDAMLDIREAFLNLLDANKKDKVKKVKENLNTTVSNLLFSKGLQFASIFIENLMSEIDKHRDDIERERRRFEDNLEKGRYSEKYERKRKEALERAYSAFFLSRGKKVEEAKRIYSEWLIKKLNNIEELELRKKVEQFYDEIQNYLRDLKEILEYVWDNILESIKSEFRKGVDLPEAPDLGGKRNLAEHYVVETYIFSDRKSVDKYIYNPNKPKEIDKIAQKFVRGEEELGLWPLFNELLKNASTLLRERKLYSKILTEEYKKSIKDFLFRIASEPFQNALAEMTIEKALYAEAEAVTEEGREQELRDLVGQQEFNRLMELFREGKSRKDPNILQEIVSVRLSRAIRRSAPFWNMTAQPLVSGDLNDLLLVGYNSVSSPGLNENLKKAANRQEITAWSHVSIGDKNQILIFRASYGAPFDILKGVEERFKESYIQVKSQPNAKPLHTDRRYEYLVTEVRVHYYLSIAEELGIVRVDGDQISGKFIIEGLKEEAIPSMEIGRGREEAVRILSEIHPEYLFSLQERVERKLREMDELQIYRLYTKVRDKLFELSEGLKHLTDLSSLLQKEARVFAEYAKDYFERNRSQIELLEAREKGS